MPPPPPPPAPVPGRFLTLGEGWFADVALDFSPVRRGWICARAGDPRYPGQVKVWEWLGDDLLTLRVIRAISLPAGSPCFPKLCFHNSVLWLAYHDGIDGHLVNMSTGEARVLSPCQNNSPFCFGAGFFAWQGAGRDNWPVTRLALGTLSEIRHVRNGQGTGLSRVLPDWSIRTVDEDRLALPGATIPCFYEDLAVGEGPRGGTIWQIDPSPTPAQAGPRGLITWSQNGAGAQALPRQDAYEPRCAVDNGRIAICTAGGPYGIRLWVGQRADLLQLVDVPDVVEPPGEPPNEPPDHPPDPPKEPPMSWTPRMPNRQSVVEQLKAAHPDEWDAMNRLGDTRLIKRIAWALHQQDANFGLNGKRGGDLLSEDCVAYLNDTVNPGTGVLSCETADIVVAHGSPDARPGWQNITQPVSEGGAGAKWIRPEPISDQPPIPPIPPTQPPQPDWAARLATLEAHDAAQKIQITQLITLLETDRLAIAALTEKLSQVPSDLSQLVRKGHPVQVMGTISVAGFSRTITSKGTL